MRWYLTFLVAGCVLAWAASSSRPSAADPSGAEESTPNPGEPITGEVAVPNEAPSSVPKSPFEPYGIGEAIPNVTNPAWSYEQLSSAEQAVVDRGREPSQAAQWSAVHEAYKAAVVLRAAEAQAQAAAIRLGIENLGEGVVP